MNADHIFVVKSDPNAKDAALVKRLKANGLQVKNGKI